MWFKIASSPPDLDFCENRDMAGVKMKREYREFIDAHK